MADALRKTTIEIDWKVNNNALQRANEETDKIIAKSGRMESGYNQSASAINNATNSVGKYNQSAKDSTSNVIQFERKSKSAFNEAGQGASSAKNNVVKMNTELDRTGNKAVAAGGKVKNSLNATKNNVIDLTGKFGSMAEGVDSSTNKVASSIERGINKPLNAAKGILVGLLATAGVAGAGSLFNAGINRLSSIEDARMSMEVMMGGDVKRADAFLDEILDFAKTTPYAFTQLSTSAKNLFAYGMDQKNIVPTLKAIGDLSAASGKGSEGIDSLAAAFGKMQVSGKASGEQLTQITEAGVPALKILANQAGVSVEEIQKQIASGKVSANTAISGLVKGIAEGTDGVAGKTQALGGVMEKLKQTWKGSLDSMKSSVTSTMATLLTPAKPKIQAGMAWFSNEFKKLPEIVEKSSNMMAPAWEPTQEVLASGKDFIKNDFIPTLKTLAVTLGPGFVEGGVISLKAFAWTVDNVVKPPVLFLKEFAEEHPKAMKNIAKYSAIGLASIYGFSKISKLMNKGTTSVFKLIAAISKIGSTTLAESAKAKMGFKIIEDSAEGAETTVKYKKNSAYYINEIQQNVSGKGIKGKLGNFSKWMFRGSRAQQALPSSTLETMKAQNAMLKTSGQLSMSARRTQALASSSFRLSQAGAAMKGLGSLKGFAKAIPGLSWLSAGANLIGMNKENVNEKIGSSGGMLAGGAVGAKAGAAIGTLIAPGIGTAIGSAIGGIAGTAFGSEFGKRAGNWLKDNGASLWEGLKTNAFTGGIALGIEGAFKEGKKAFDKGVEWLSEAKGNIDDFFGNPLETKVKADGDLSKETAKKWNAYMGDYNTIEQLHAKQGITGTALSENERKKLSASYDGMNTKVTNEFESKRNKSAKNVDYLAQSGVISSSVAGMAKNTSQMEFNRNKKELDYLFSVLKDLESKQQKEIEESTKRSEERKNKIRERARKENRSLSEFDNETIKGIESQLQDEIRQIEYSGQKERQEILDRQNKETAGIMSDSAKEQIILLENLKMNTGKISAKQAADVVQNSYEAKSKTIADANEKFEKTKAILDEELHINKTITKEQYDDAIQKATETKDGVIKEATEKHEGVVDQAKRQAEGHLEQVDWETGEVLSKWDIFKNSSLETLTGLGTSLGEMWDATGKGIVGFFDGMTQGAVNAWNGLRNSVGKIANWFIDDINNITTFFDASWKIPRMKTNHGEVASKNMNSGGFTQMQYKGSSGNYHGTALVGEEGPELAYNKTTSQARIIGQRGAEMTHINSGERVLNHRDTMKVLNGGYGEGMVLPGFANGLGGKVSDFVGSGIEKGKEIVSSAWNGAKEIGTEAMEWLDDPVGKITALVSKHNKFKKSNSLPGLGWHSINKIGEGAKNWVQEKFDSISFGGGIDDGSVGANGVYSYLMSIANGLMKKYNMVFTSGYRPGDPYDHGKGLAVDIALPGVTNGSPVYKKAADEASRMPGVKYVITNGMWKQRGQGWVPWPDGDHYDHVHISGEKPSGTSVKGDGSVNGWRSQVQRASSFMGARANAREINGVLAQIQRESGGNQRITQSSSVWDVNMANGNPAQGLLQYIPSTFKAYRMRGHENILNGYHQLVAFFNNSNWRNDLPYGRSGWGPSGIRVRGYEKGGRPKVRDTVLVGENGPELFEADTAGTVHSYDKTRGLFEKTAPSIEFNPTINIEVNGDVSDDTTSKIKRAVKEALEEQYAKLFNQFNSGGVV